MESHRDINNVDLRGKPQAAFQTVNVLPSCVVESDAVEADIQTILTRHGIQGVIEHLNQAELVYGDVSDLTDFADAMRQVKEAEGMFLQLPSKVREAFEHDPAIWLDAANDGMTGEQFDKLVKLGFLEKPEEEVEIPVALPETEGGE